jgi:hypothetical protein
VNKLEPYPENIDGSVSYSHEIHHKVNWGYVAGRDCGCPISQRKND